MGLGLGLSFLVAEGLRMDWMSRSKESVTKSERESGTSEEEFWEDEDA